MWQIPEKVEGLIISLGKFLKTVELICDWAIRENIAKLELAQQ